MQQITQQKIETLIGKLKNTPKPNAENRALSKQAAIKKMASSINELRKKGYSLEQVAEILTENEFPISKTTLGNYLLRAKKPKSKTQQPQKSPPKSATEKKSKEKTSTPTIKEDRTDL
jgi:DNA-binding transcriptional MerR regulator